MWMVSQLSMKHINGTAGSWCLLGGPLTDSCCVRSLHRTALFLHLDVLIEKAKPKPIAWLYFQWIEYQVGLRFDRRVIVGADDFPSFSVFLFFLFFLCFSRVIVLGYVSRICVLGYVSIFFLFSFMSVRYGSTEVCVHGMFGVKGWAWERVRVQWRDLFRGFRFRSTQGSDNFTVLSYNLWIAYLGLLTCKAVCDSTWFYKVLSPALSVQEKVEIRMPDLQLVQPVARRSTHSCMDLAHTGPWAIPHFTLEFVGWKPKGT